MKYLRIKNNGELDIRLISLMGGSTKTDDATKIGQFGTGLKYAISYFVRTETKFRLFIGTEEVIFSTQSEEIANNTFKEIYCNGKSMNITTQYGYQWEAWEAIREVWCNAIDEGGENRSVIASTGHIKGAEGSTSFYIEETVDIKSVMDNWGNYFISETPIYEDENVAIYPNTDKTLKLYKNHVLIQNAEHYNSLFLYDFKQAELNELRQYRGYLTNDVAKALLSSNKAVISLLLESIAKKADLYEAKIDWSYLTYNKTKVKHIFQGWLFLHPSSNSESKGKTVIVGETLFDLLNSVGLPCEKVQKSYGGFYGSSGIGYNDKSEVTYKEVGNSDLKERIDNVLIKYNSKAKFIIAVPKTKDFEILVTDKNIVFNSFLEKLSETDLETTVLVAIFHTQEGNLYKAFRRLIKIVMSNKNFKRILFGDSFIKKPKAHKEEYQTSNSDDTLPF